MEKTVILLKPDCYEHHLIGEVIGRFEKGGLKICGCKMMRLSEDLLQAHYVHLVDKPFFPEIVAFMQSTPVLALVLEGEGVIDRVRDMIGPTDSTQAPKGTVRGDLGEDKMRNLVHASDSPEAAAAELERFFESHEIYCE